MGLLNSLVYFLRRNWLIFGFLFIGALALGQAYYDQINVDNLRLDGNTISSTNTNGDITLDPNGTGGVAFPDLTASTVPYLDANKELVSSAVTPTELGYLDGVTSAIQTQIDGLATGTLTDSYIFVGNASNEATGVAVSGDIAMANDGTVSISSGVITNSDVNASAGIEMSKLEALTASRVPVLDGSGFLSASSVTSTTLGYLDATSSIQTQLDAKLDDFTGSADNLLLRTNGAGGDAVQESGITVDDSNNISGIETLIVEGLTATPSTPSAGTLAIYAKDDNNVYKLNSSGVETEIGAGGGGSGTGSVNYFQDYQADDQGTYVAEFDDTSAIVDGTGNSAANLSQSTETTNPLSGSNSYKLSKDVGANAQYEGWSMDTDTPDRTSTVGGETVYITFNYETSANYDNSASGEQVSVYVYRVGSNTLEACSARDVLSGSFTNALPVAPDGGQYQCVTTLESTDTAVRVIFGITGTGTSTWDLIVDKIKVGPDAVVTAPIVTETQSYTPIWTGGSPSIGNGTLSGTYKIIGDTLYGTVYLLAGSTTTFGSGQWEFSLPSGYTIDTTKLNNSNSVQSSYVAYANDQTGSIAVGTVQLNSSNDTVYIWSQGGTSSWRSTVPFSWANTDYLSFSYEVPIEQSSGNAILSATQADHRFMEGKIYQTSNQAVAATSATLNFGSESYDTHSLCSGNSCIVPKTGRYKVGASVYLTGLTDDEAGQLDIRANGTAIATKARNSTAATDQFVIPSTDVELTEGQTITVLMAVASDTSWTINSGERLTYLTIERVDETGSTFSVYGPYEYTEAEATTTSTTSTATTYVDVTGMSISLSPGTWQMCYEAHHFHEWNSGASGTICQSIIRDSSNNVVNGTAQMTSVITDATYSSFLAPANACAEVTITSATTYKFSIQSSVTANTCAVFVGDFTGAISAPDVEAKIWARRMK